jgi:hypothetical protein
MTMSALSDLACDRERVSQMLDDGMPFGQIESTIERLDMPDEQKSALWLLAWSRPAQHRQKRVPLGRGVGKVSQIMRAVRVDPRF